MFQQAWIERSLLAEGAALTAEQAHAKGKVRSNPRNPPEAALGSRDPLPRG